MGGHYLVKLHGLFRLLRRVDDGDIPLKVLDNVGQCKKLFSVEHGDHGLPVASLASLQFLIVHRLVPVVRNGVEVSEADTLQFGADFAKVEEV